ncbi:MAG TPA: DUF308 domain-containing protein [Candidatus Eisenbacteria bacterium]|nr:DUF308 domain-containing protein [Candidatus Eisenbacteria bacterium]
MRAFGEVRGTAASTPWWLVLLEGIAGLLIGILLLTQTGVTLFTLILFVGVYWFVTGIIDLVMLFVDSRQWGWKLLSGVIGILAGLVVIRHPAWATVLIPTTLVWLLGIAGIVIGVVAFVRAFMGGGLPSAILGVISVILGALLLFNTVFATAVLVYVVAIWAVIAGIFAIVAAFWLRGQQHGAARASQQPLPGT